jgi:hypothetical protein
MELKDEIDELFSSGFRAEPKTKSRIVIHNAKPHKDLVKKVERLEQQLGQAKFHLRRAKWFISRCGLQKKFQEAKPLYVEKINGTDD